MMQMRKPALVATLAVALAALAGAGPADAQFSDCGDTLALYSPESLQVEFQRVPVRGNRLIWPAVDPDLGSCFGLVVPPAVEASVDPDVTGSYRNPFDRLLRLSFDDTGTVGNPGPGRVQLTLDAPHPNPEIRSLQGSANLANNGGFFRGDLDAGTVVRDNDGIPQHLVSTDIRAVATWEQGASSRVYAAINGLPLVRRDDNGPWVEPSAGALAELGLAITRLAVDPANPDRLFLGTERNGIFLSTDGGTTVAPLDVPFITADPGSRARVQVLAFLTVDDGTGPTSRLYAGTRNSEIFVSFDSGANWAMMSALRVPPSSGSNNCPLTAPASSLSPAKGVLAVAVSPGNPGRMFASTQGFGLYRSDNGGNSWYPTGSDMLECSGNAGDPERSFIRVPQALELSVTANEANPVDDVIVLGTNSSGGYISSNTGSTWLSALANGWPTNQDGFPLRASGIARSASDWQTFYVATPDSGVYVGTGLGTSWAPWAGQANLPRKATTGLWRVPGGSAEYLIGTAGGGIYTPGTPLSLTRMVGLSSNLGLELTLQAGNVNAGEGFQIRAQAQQGYVVWRATEDDPATGEPEWVLLGMYDLNNPETCFIQPCDVSSQTRLPNCYADKRANCFAFSASGDTVTFFDREIFNGFTYRYAVSSYDYGFTGNVSPFGFNGEMLFSPRSPQEDTPEATPFAGLRGGANYNIQVFQVNVDPSANFDGVYVVPNPLRRSAGWDGEDESSVRIVNVTPTTRAEVYTLAGDLVIELENVEIDGLERGNIEWDTRNDSGELVASGVYIYRIFDDAGNEQLGRITIIR